MGRPEMTASSGEAPFSVLALAAWILVSGAATVAVILVAVRASGAVARHLESPRWIAALTLFGFGLVLVATLLPTLAALDGQPSSGVCDLSRVGLPPLRKLTSVNLVSLNVVLFVPLGVAVGLVPWNRGNMIVIVAAVSLTFVVETIQLALPILGRGCESADMIDNSLGLALGLVVGLLARPHVGRT